MIASILPILEIRAHILPNHMHLKEEATVLDSAIPIAQLTIPPQIEVVAAELFDYTHSVAGDRCLVI